MIKSSFLRACLLTKFTLAAALLGMSSLAFVPNAAAQQRALRVAVLTDITNFDPMQFSTVNYYVIKNLYDSLIEYTPEGKPVPSLASEWKIAADNMSVIVVLREGVLFQSGAALTAADVAATLEKAADPKRGKNVYPTISIVKDWSTQGEHQITINFRKPVPERQILDLLQFTMPIEAKGISTVETVPAGTGPYKLEKRSVGQSLKLVANTSYWRKDEPKLSSVDFTIFSDDASASAALESDAVDLVYGGEPRSAVRLRSAGYQVIQGPGPLAQTLRVNATRPPLNNEKLRQALLYLVDRDSMVRAAYAGLGEPAVLPWAKSSPAYDPSFVTTYAYNPEKAKELIKASGLTPAQLSGWKLLVFGNDQAAVTLSQILQGSLAEVGVNIELDVREGSEYVDAQLTGKYDATFSGIGNIQKFPSRVAVNSIYRIANNPVLGEPNPFRNYVAAIQAVNDATGHDDQTRTAYANLNKALVDSAFAIPTNLYDVGLIVASEKLENFTLDIDNLLVARTIQFKN